MKTIIHFLMISLFTIGPLLASEFCKIDYEKYKLKAPVDCVVCQNDIKIPADKVEVTVNPLINFVTNEKDQADIIRKFKVQEHFLSGKENASRCSNYNSIKKEFAHDFQTYVSTCEKGPDLLDKQKLICEWVLPKYNSKIIDSFYAYWSEVGPDGKVKFKPGKYKEDLESSIRAQESWCRKVEKNYKNRIFLSCGDLKDWVHEFDITKKVSEAMKRDMQSSENQSNSAAGVESDRKKMFQDACKYFDTHAATTFTQNFYLECITN